LIIVCHCHPDRSIFTLCKNMLTSLWQYSISSLLLCLIRNGFCLRINSGYVVLKNRFSNSIGLLPEIPECSFLFHLFLNERKHHTWLQSQKWLITGK
jgi:hypothetical protein